MNKEYLIEELKKSSIIDGRKLIAGGKFGEIDSPNYKFCTAYLDAREAEEREAKESLSLSISRKALFVAKIAMILSAIMAILQIIVWLIGK